MTGTAIIGELLRAFADLIAIVPEARIKAGALPEGAEMPLLLVRRVSKIRRQRLKQGATVRKVDRISVTVRASSYREQVEIMGLVEACCADWTGNIGGGTSVSILDAGSGPDLRGPNASFEQTQDFHVSYDA